MGPIKTEYWLGKHETAVASVLSALTAQSTVRRVWKKDHSVWSPQPAEIVDRLGWLDLPTNMAAQVPALTEFAGEVRRAGYRHVVVLGMGGSSLVSVTLATTFGHADGYPETLVLDSTVPESVQAVADAIDPSASLFVLSSKSGTTMEPLLLYRYFRDLLTRTPGAGNPGEHFLAITDPGTPLVDLAGRDGFRRIFLADPEVGGRYSALSHFGLVPAALSGIDVASLLQRSRDMRTACGSDVPDGENPGLWLGACMGAMAPQHIDKLTVLCSPGVAGFGVWAEQLIAESTGKNHTGIVPVVNEPELSVEQYGNDRFFVCLRLEGDDNRETDGATERLKQAGRPLVVLRMNDTYDLGAEFFRWELATAVAGAVLGVNPFDQPDVQASKTATTRMLRQYSPTLRLLVDEPSDTLGHLVMSAREGDYLAVMAYLHETPEVDAALQRVRLAVTERYHIPVTVGYGPRFLHSTGQLHKGGPDTGLFFQITSRRTGRQSGDVSIPGEPYTFGFAAGAQASGDLEALQAAGRRVAWVRLEDGSPEDIRRLASAIG
jgi:transaldolase / glucose-6-phosphate isomerase